MPEMDGFQATTALRQRPGRQPFIVAMTAGALEEERQKCLSAGMDAFLAKPVRLGALRTVVERAIANSAAFR